MHVCNIYFLNYLFIVYNYFPKFPPRFLPWCLPFVHSWCSSMKKGFERGGGRKEGKGFFLSGVLESCSFSLFIKG